MAVTDWLSVAPVVGGVASSLIQGSQNAKLAREQREWDYKMWQENNAYNTPAAQVKRLRDAGLNPSMAMMNGALSSGTSSQSPGGQTAPTYDFSPMAQGMRDSVDLFYQKRMQDADINFKNEQAYNQSIKNRFENTRQILELDKLLSDKNLSDSQREYYTQERNRLIKENSWIDQKNSSMIARNDAEAFKAQEEARHTRLMNEYQKLVNDFTPQEQQKILNNLEAQYSQILSATAANNSQAALNAANKAVSEAQKKGVDIDNNQKSQLVEHVVNKAKQEVEMIRDNREINWLKLSWETEGSASRVFKSNSLSDKSMQGYYHTHYDTR